VTPCRQPDAQADRKLQLDFLSLLAAYLCATPLLQLTLPREWRSICRGWATEERVVFLSLVSYNTRRVTRRLNDRRPYPQRGSAHDGRRSSRRALSWVRNGCFVMSPGPQTASNPFESSSAFRTMRGDRSAQQRKNARFADRTVPGGLGASRLAGGER
jgi:hypothetical protein